MVRIKVGLLVCLLFAGAMCAGANAGKARIEAEIKRVIESYVSAFNRGDAAAVASHWTETGSFIGPEGAYIEGRKQIQDELEKMLAEAKGVKLEVRPIAIHLEAPNEVIEEGIAVTTRPGEEPNTTRYAAAYARDDGEWKMTRVREIALPTFVSHYKKLKDLEWMIGDWVDEDFTGTVETSCYWTPDRNFIVRAYSIKVEGLPILQGKQIIGWDPAGKKIRSWVFDSSGAIGVGAWTKQGNSWLVSAALTLNNGTKASSINVLTPVDENSFTWQAKGREIAGTPLPNTAKVTVIRKQANQEANSSELK